MRNNARLALIGCLILAAAGCESRSFKAEREIYRAQKKALAIYKNPKGTPPFEVRAAQADFEKILRKYPGTILATQAQMGIGHLYLASGDYDSAREAYKSLLKDCEKNAAACAQVTFVIGQSYEVENKWPEALAQYSKVIEDYPLSGKSVELPIYIINHYKKLKDDKGVEVWVQKGVAHYRDLMAKAEQPRVDYALMGLTARCYMAGERWQDAVTVLEQIARDYPDLAPEQALWAQAFIYKRFLNDPGKSKDLLQRIVKDYPQTNLAKQAELLLTKL
jgi:TolA-binding protein